MRQFFLLCARETGRVVDSQVSDHVFFWLYLSLHIISLPVLHVVHLLEYLQRGNALTRLLLSEVVHRMRLHRVRMCEAHFLFIHRFFLDERQRILV